MSTIRASTQFWLLRVLSSVLSSFRCWMWLRSVSVQNDYLLYCHFLGAFHFYFLQQHSSQQLSNMCHHYLLHQVRPKKCLAKMKMWPYILIDNLQNAQTYCRVYYLSIRNNVACFYSLCASTAFIKWTWTSLWHHQYGFNPIIQKQFIRNSNWKLWECRI